MSVKKKQQRSSIAMREIDWTSLKSRSATVNLICYDMETVR